MHRAAYLDLVMDSYASRILKEASVWKRPVPFSEPDAKKRKKEN